MNLNIAREKPKLSPENWYEEVVLKKSSASISNLKDKIFIHLQQIDPELVGKERFKKPDFMIIEMILVIYLKGIYYISKIYFRKDVKLLKPRYELLEKKLYQALKKEALFEKVQIVKEPITIKIPKKTPENLLGSRLALLNYSPKIENFLLETFLLDGIKKFSVDKDNQFTIHFKSEKKGVIRNSENSCLVGARVVRDLKITGVFTENGIIDMRGLSFENTYLGFSFKIGVAGLQKKQDKYHLIPRDLKEYYFIDPRNAISLQLFAYLNSLTFRDHTLIKWLAVVWD